MSQNSQFLEILQWKFLKVKLEQLELFYLTDHPKGFLSLFLCVTVPSQLKKTKELGHPHSINRQSEQLIVAVTKPVHPA